MRKFRIVADSSANLLSSDGVDFAGAPLKIITNEREFIDDENLDVGEMVDYFEGYKGRSQTSCPNPSDWLSAFGDADDILCITITSGLSGCYGSACVAREIFESENEGKRVYIIDTLSTGPEMALLIEKATVLYKSGESFEEICRQTEEYLKSTGLLFMLESLKNFAANGRVSPALAKVIGFLGIRIVGKASDKGQLEPLNKCCGEARSLESMLSMLKSEGWRGGKIRIAHCRNLPAAERLIALLKSEKPECDIVLSECRGLCSYYAENGGLLVGFEKN